MYDQCTVLPPKAQNSQQVLYLSTPRHGSFSCVETAILSGCAPTQGIVIVGKMENMVIQILLLGAVSKQVCSVMVMDETSCVEMEEEECGICHTIYMEECKMKMVEEMMPTKVSICKNVTR